MTEAIIVIAILAVLVAAFVIYRASRERAIEGRRTEAQELRETAQTHDQRAELEQAEADRQAARARKAQAEAEEKAAIARSEAVAAQERSQAAEREGGLAREHHERARAIDPDVDEPHDELGRDEAHEGYDAHDEPGGFGRDEADDRLGRDEADAGELRPSDGRGSERRR
jgi:FtsZ-interacting cell division protein ZipA